MSGLISWVSVAAIAAVILSSGCAAELQGAAAKAKIFRVEDYGAVADDATDSGPGIRKAIAAAIASGEPAKVVLKAGVYRAGADPTEKLSRACFPIVDATDLSIEGVKGKTELIMTVPDKGCFRAFRSKNLWIRNVTIDYDPLPFTQGKIVAVNAEAGEFDLELDEGFPLLGEPWFATARSKWGMPFDPKERRLKFGVVDSLFMESYTLVRGRVFRMRAVRERKWAVSKLEVGDRWVQLARTRGPGGVGFWQCQDSGVEDVTVHASPSVAGLIVACEKGMVIRRLQARYRKGTKRLLTTNADALHCPANRVGPLIEECLFEGMADDSVNFYCRPNLVLEVLGPRKILVSRGVDIRPGDRVQIIYPPTGRLKGEAKVIEVERQTRPRRYQLTLDRDIADLKAGKDSRTADTLFNLDASGEGYIIRNNVMRNHRRHGLLLRAGKGLIEGNRFENLAGLGIVITNEPNWPEGPMGRDIVIRNNTFIGCGRVGYGHRPNGGMITVQAQRIGYRLAEGHGARRITIEGNTIIDPLRVGIYIGSAEDVKIVNNTIKASAKARIVKDSIGVVLDQCGKVTIDKLTVTDPRPGAKAAVKILSSVEPGETGVTITGLKTKLPADVPDVIDQRKE